jgi:hypothetical protein
MILLTKPLLPAARSASPHPHHPNPELARRWCLGQRLALTSLPEATFPTLEPGTDPLVVRVMNEAQQLLGIGAITPELLIAKVVLLGDASSGW